MRTRTRMRTKTKNKKGKPKFKAIFGNKRIVGLAGNKSTGKTNNLFYLLRDLRKCGNKTEVYAFGFGEELKPLLDKLKVKEISSLKHLVNKKDCLLIIDEMQKLKLNDRRYKDVLKEFVNFVYHNNVKVVLSSPDIREFNSVIGAYIERWLLKSVNVNQCVNGSQLKKAIQTYQGNYQLLGSVTVPKNKLLLLNEKEEVTIKCDYVKEADTKKEQKELF